MIMNITEHDFIVEVESAMRGIFYDDEKPFRFIKTDKYGIKSFPTDEDDILYHPDERAKGIMDTLFRQYST